MRLNLIQMSNKLTWQIPNSLKIILINGLFKIKKKVNWSINLIIKINTNKMKKINI